MGMRRQRIQVSRGVGPHLVLAPRKGRATQSSAPRIGNHFTEARSRRRCPECGDPLGPPCLELTCKQKSHHLMVVIATGKGSESHREG